MTKQDDMQPQQDSTQTTIPKSAQALPSNNNYKLLSTLGEGGFGVVYLAEQTNQSKEEYR